MIHDLQLTIDDQINNRYLAIPVDVPSGAAGLHVAIEAPQGQSVVDLGCEGPSGWRGWSGGARTEFTIGSSDATPGYLPGELESGEWSVILGLHQIPPSGMPIRVHAEVLDRVELPPPALAPVAASGPPQGSSRPVPAEPGLRWFAGDFHAHTHHSDGSESVDELAARARAAGLDFLAVTDHNTTSHHAHLRSAGARHGVSLLPGQEVTRPDGHANAFGEIGWVDFRNDAHQWVTDVAQRGGILSINHPTDADCAWIHVLDDHPVALEAWHISWYRDLTATGPLAFWRQWDAGPPTSVPIGGSDFHRPGQGWTVGTPTTWVAAEDDSPEAIFAAVAAGRTSISVGVRPDATPDPMNSPLLVRLGNEVRALGAETGILIDGTGRRTRITAQDQAFEAPTESGPYRIIDDNLRIIALTA